MANLPQPDFCLLIPCFNNQEGLVRSLSSVSYPRERCLVLVVDDGSAIPVDAGRITQEINDSLKITVLRLAKNGGITAALNAGLAWISENLNTGLVARLDCGDMCVGTRFRQQFELMQGHPDVVLAGSWCYFRDYHSGEQYRYITAITHESIIREMYVRNVFMHPTVMYRTNILPVTGFYPENFELAEDYAFFWTLLEHGRAAVIPEFLVTCEISKSGISFANKGKQLVARWKVVRTFGTAPVLKLRGFLRLAGLLILPKELILWLKKKIA